MMQTLTTTRQRQDNSGASGTNQTHYSAIQHLLITTKKMTKICDRKQLLREKAAKRGFEVVRFFHIEESDTLLADVDVGYVTEEGDAYSLNGFYDTFCKKQTK